MQQNNYQKTKLQNSGCDFVVPFLDTALAHECRILLVDNQAYDLQPCEIRYISETAFAQGERLDGFESSVIS